MKHFLIFLNIFRKTFFLKYPPLKPKTKLKIGLVWVLTSLRMPGMIEHCTSTHKELQCFQMRENSVFWTCPTPNQTETKNPWNVLSFTQKYIICPMCKFEIQKKVFIAHPTALALLDLCVQGKCDSQRINIGEIYSNSGPKKFDTLKYLFWSLPNNGQILSSMLSIKFWWQSCDNECCLVEWQHYDSPTSEYSNISQLQSRTVSESGLEQDTLRWLSPGSRLLDTPVPASGPLWLSQVSFCQITRGIIYCQTINTQAVNYGDVQRVEIPCY